MIDRPLFIGGLSHSGKSPLRAVLDHHPDLTLSRHSALWTRHWGRFGELADPTHLDRAIQTLCADRAVRALRPDGDRLRGLGRDRPAGYPQLFAAIHQHHAELMGTSRWGDQLGLVETLADPILEAFPDARLVHLVRDPRDRLACTGARRPGATGWHTARWLDNVGTGLAQAQRRPHRYLIVRYESLAAEPVATVRRIARFCELEPVPEVEAAAAALRLAGAPELAPRRAAFVESRTTEIRSALGYPARPPAPRRAADGPGHLADRCALAVGRHFGSRPPLRPAAG